MSEHKVGERRDLSNGAAGEYRLNANGKLVFRIVQGANKAGIKKMQEARKHPRKISKAEAQAAYDKYYTGRRPNIRRGPRKGTPRFSSPRGMRAAGTYDLNHTNQRVITDARYLRNPHRYDFEGVDTGSRVRKPVSEKQRAALERGRAVATRNRRTRIGNSSTGIASMGYGLQDQQGGMQYQQDQQSQQGGFWW